jgi:hypothetical protein
MDRMMFSTDSMELLSTVKKTQQETIRSVLLDETPKTSEFVAPKGRQKRIQRHHGVTSLSMVGGKRTHHDDDDDDLHAIEKAKGVEDLSEEDEEEEEEEEEEDEEEEVEDHRRRGVRRDGEVFDGERKKMKKRKLAEKEMEEDGGDGGENWGQMLRDAGGE